MSYDKCDEEVYRDGVSVGIFDMTREQADEFCRAKTESTGFKYDWHRIAGRVHVKALIKEKV